MFTPLKAAFMKGWRGGLRYGYFAPVTAAWLAITRRGSYLHHLRALYRLTFWGGPRHP